jgi:hypothetical protein
MSKVVVPAKYAGPPNMGHGGYVAGLFTAHIDGALQVTLRRPIPVDVELDIVATDDGRVELRHDETVVADAQAASLDIDVPPAPTVHAARAAEVNSPSRRNGRGVHPTCFGCGLARDDDEGLEIAVGPVSVDGRDQVAAIWRPGPDRIVFEQFHTVTADVDHVLTGWQIGIEGKKMFAGTALSAIDGRVVAAAKATWFGWS